MRAFACSLAAVLLGSAGAFASSTYPGLVNSDLGLGRTPGCELCHFNGQGATGTATTPVGKALRARGLVAQNPMALSSALSALATDKADSDGDGVGDVDELKAGTDPNVPNGSADGGSFTPGVKLPTPSYGCSAVPGALPLAGLALVSLRRRRRS